MTVRSIVAALIIGACAAAGLVYFFTESTRQYLLANWLRAPEQAAATELWPICTTMGAVADNVDWAELDPDFAAGKKALATENWRDAIAALSLAALREPQNADIQNYIGYAYRRLRQLGPAIDHYQHALALNPRHRSAHEHLGEAHLVTGNLRKAEDHLAALRNICLLPCTEYDDLQRAIATFKSFTTR